MTQVQETLQAETGSVVVESQFNARKEVESRSLFERLTFRGEATPRVEAQTLVAEQGVPNLTQGVDASEKRGGFISVLIESLGRLVIIVALVGSVIYLAVPVVVAIGSLFTGGGASLIFLL